jgi:polar amino acid transport system substrate-binding protein
VIQFRFLFSFLVFTFGFLTGPATAQVEVQIIGYPFPPFVVDKANGLTQRFAELLNGAQSEFRFTFSLTSPNRRYREFTLGTGDLVLFEMPDWGWKTNGIAFEATRRMFTGGEIFIARATQGRDQVYFDDLSSKRIVAHSGYHYGFAGYNSDPAWLKQNFDIILTNNHLSNIRVVLANRADVSIVTQSFLNQYLHENPQFRSQLLISKKMDQVYHLGGLIRKNGPITASQLESILGALEKSGELATFFANYGLKSHLVYK